MRQQFSGIGKNQRNGWHLTGIRKDIGSGWLREGEAEATV